MLIAIFHFSVVPKERIIKIIVSLSLSLLENIQEQPNGKELDSRTKSEVAVGVTTRTSVFQG